LLRSIIVIIIIIIIITITTITVLELVLTVGCTLYHQPPFQSDLLPFG